MADSFSMSGTSQEKTGGLVLVDHGGRPGALLTNPFQVRLVRPREHVESGPCLCILYCSPA